MRLYELIGGVIAGLISTGIISLYNYISNCFRKRKLSINLKNEIFLKLKSWEEQLDVKIENFQTIDNKKITISKHAIKFAVSEDAISILIRLIEVKGDCFSLNDKHKLLDSLGAKKKFLEFLKQSNLTPAFKPETEKDSHENYIKEFRKIVNQIKV